MRGRGGIGGAELDGGRDGETARSPRRAARRQGRRPCRPGEGQGQGGSGRGRERERARERERERRREKEREGGRGRAESLAAAASDSADGEALRPREATCSLRTAQAPERV